MAKISARGNHSVGKITASLVLDELSGEEVHYLFALRSDGKVLRRVSKIGDKRVSGGYSIYGSLKAKESGFSSEDLTRLGDALSRKGFSIVKVER